MDQQGQPKGDLMKHIFLSYASDDKELAGAMTELIESKGARCWIASRDIAAGEEWSQAIVNAIVKSRLVGVVVSAAASASVHVLREVHQAVQRGIPLCPLRLDGAEATGGLDYYVSTCQWLNVDSREPAHAATALVSQFSQLALTAESDVGRTAENLNPRVRPYYCLVHSEHVVPLCRTRFTIGRSRDCDVTLDDVKASRSHCSLNWVEELGTYSLVDHGSLNCVVLNGEKVHAARPLAVGDRFVVGSTAFQFDALKNQALDTRQAIEARLK
jgi:hypothetical protein